MSDVQFRAARLPGGRSGKDLLAHLTFWDHRLLHAIAPQDGPQAFRLAPPLIADIPIDDQWVDSVNERIFQLNRDGTSRRSRLSLRDLCRATPRGKG